MMMSVVVVMPPVMVAPMMMVMPVEARRSPISVRAINPPVRNAVAPTIEVPTRTATPADLGDRMRRICRRCRGKRLCGGCHAKEAGGEQCRCKNLHLFLRAVGCLALKNVPPEWEMKRGADFRHICQQRRSDRPSVAADCALAPACGDLYDAGLHRLIEISSRRRSHVHRDESVSG
mgnify:CR=1 FL=1